MTKREHEIVRQAVRELMREDGDFTAAVSALCRLIGYRYPAAEVNVETAMPIARLAQLKENQPFSVRLPRAEGRKRKGD